MKDGSLAQIKESVFTTSDSPEMAEIETKDSTAMGCGQASELFRHRCNA